MSFINLFGCVSMRAFGFFFIIFVLVIVAVPAFFGTTMAFFGATVALLGATIVLGVAPLIMAYPFFTFDFTNLLNSF